MRSVMTNPSHKPGIIVIGGGAGGLALVSERMDLDYGVRIDLGEPVRTWHAVDVRVRF